jgi:hypothetical protein
LRGGRDARSILAGGWAGAEIGLEGWWAAVAGLCLGWRVLGEDWVRVLWRRRRRVCGEGC